MPSSGPSSGLGASISAVEITHISAHGFWLLMQETEHFLSFDDFPWFRQTRIEDILAVEEPAPGHLYWPIYWPRLDVALSLAIIEHPERFPLVDRGSHTGPSR